MSTTTIWKQLDWAQAAHWLTTLTHAWSSSLSSLSIWFLESSIGVWLTKLNGHPKLIRITNWVFKLLTLNIYIRMMVESNQFWLITSIYEINLAQIYSANRLVSLIIAWFLLSVWLKFLIIVIIKTRSSMKQETQLFKATFSELFEGMKDNKLSKLFTAVQMIRRISAVAFLMSLSQLYIYVKISIFLMLNIINLLYVVFTRPMKIVKENFITILNEVLLIVLTCLLYLWNTQTDWSKLYEYIFIVSITAWSLIIFSVLAGNSILIFKAVNLFVVDLIIDLCKKYWKSKKSRVQQLKSHL